MKIKHYALNVLRASQKRRGD